MSNTDYGKPIRIFYANLLSAGLVCRVAKENGKLVVEGNTDVLSPVYEQEIVKRAKHLVALLTPPPPVELEPYFGRLLKLDELKAALGMAEHVSTVVDATPCNGGWLLTTPPTGFCSRTTHSQYQTKQSFFSQGAS